MDDTFCEAHALYAAGKEHWNTGNHTDAYQNWLKSIGMIDPLKGENERRLKADVLTYMAALEMTRARWGSAFDMLSEACMLNPKKPSCHIYLAQVNFMLGRHKDAIQMAEKSVTLADEVSPNAYQTLGNIYLKTGHTEKAIAAFEKAANRAEEIAGALPKEWEGQKEAAHHLMLAHTWQWSGDRVKAKEWYLKALELNPTHPDVNLHYASYLIEDCEYLESRERFLIAANNPKNREQALWNVSLICLLLGEYETAWEKYEIRKDFLMKDKGFALANERNAGNLWNGEKNVKVHAHSEQGNGDTIQFCRYIPMMIAQDCRVVFETFEPMMALMKYNFPRAQVVPIAKNYPGLEGIPECDYQIPLMSLPRVFKTTLDNIPPAPYLKAEPEFVEKWHKKLNKACGESWESLRIGLCWAGGKRPDSPDCMRIDSRRSLSFQQIKPLLGRKNTSFVSLQLGPSVHEIDDPSVIDFSKEIESWSDTAGIIENLDLVISVDTAVMHLAAAMGKDTFLLNRFDTCWRWLLDRDDSPWYESVIIFRQKKMGEWDDVIERVRKAIP